MMTLGFRLRGLLRLAEQPLLRDAAESYPAWLDAIASAERYVHFERSTETQQPAPCGNFCRDQAAQVG